ncbi:MAG: alpha/beta fold hydrolase [Rhodobacterales bacterium]|nr:alpha/beta fold hydrolase [Rhodobacterales bacterium]
MRELDVLAGPQGLRLRVCTWGEAQSDQLPTLILHGFLEQGASWNGVAELLSGQVYAPDQRGHGLSDHVGAGGYYHFWDYVRDVDALVEWLGGQVNLVGHSMGGGVASLYAGTRPDAVRSLVIIEGLGPPGTMPMALPRARSFLKSMRNPTAHPLMPDVQNGVDRVRKYNPNIPEDVAHTLVSRTTKAVEGGLTWTWDALHRSRSPVPFNPELYLTWVRAITAPTLVIEGGTSRFRVPDFETRYAALQDGRRLTIPDAGHLMHHDQPSLLAQAIEAHFAEQA